MKQPKVYPVRQYRRSSRTGKPICQCGKGYGSEYDGVCFNCRGMTAYEAAKKGYKAFLL